MSKQYTVTIAPMAFVCLQEIESYKSGIIGAQRAAALVDELLDVSIDCIMQDPERYRFNVHLQDRGRLLRERLDVENDYRVLYDFDGENVEILLIVSTKQDFERQLYRYYILK